MCRLIESVKVYQRKLWNIEFHNLRLNNSRRILFGCRDIIDLSDKIKLPNKLSNEIYKCRIIYSKDIHSIEFIPYKKKQIDSIKLIENNFIDYEHKYENRDELNKMLINSGADEIIIIKNDYITDASFANIILSDGEVFVTPSTPLLNGTKRMKLLQEGIIREEELKKNDLRKFKFIYLINAMRDLDETSKLLIGKIVDF